MISAACHRLQHAPHLAHDEREAARRLLIELGQSGHVQIPEGDRQRRQAVAGVQWAMEACLEGPEVIITPERATPFRTHGDATRLEAQQVRERALLERLRRGDPLHLVFCRDGVGTPAQDAAYRHDILFPARQASEPLHEHLLSLDQQHFPAPMSGALIVASNAGEPIGFAIRAAQINKASTAHALTLWWGPVRTDPSAASSLRAATPHGGPQPHADGERIALESIMAQWSDFLQCHLGMSLDELLRSGSGPTTETEPRLR
ncbi:hypothetical protein OU995_18205 [Roseateles sp. SL47]|uniref:hypothetical protein n=1 Tax=Roseateles sp. SL47 TaxID=2995138 RepID=UPI002271F9CC|nr:hypothetical protein [Roseateles sp. SL47]WAC71506.1 hypothetical protein OU995_18205 [Roseateles sp. SL47]